MGAAMAPRRYLSGVMPSCDAVRSYRRLLELYPASYMARVTECPARRLLLELVHAAGVGVGSRRDAEHALESSLQMKWALMKFRSQTRQGKRFVQVLLDVAAHGLHRFRRAVAADRLRPAAQAGTVAGFLGLIGLAGRRLHSRAADAAPGTMAGNTRRSKTRQIQSLPSWLASRAQNGLPAQALAVLVAALVAGAISVASVRLSIALVVIMLKA